MWKRLEIPMGSGSLGISQFFPITAKKEDKSSHLWYFIETSVILNLSSCRSVEATALVAIIACNSSCKQIVTESTAGCFPEKTHPCSMFSGATTISRFYFFPIHGRFSDFQLWCQRASKSWSVQTLLKVWKAGVVIVWK